MKVQTTMSTAANIAQNVLSPVCVYFCMESMTMPKTMMLDMRCRRCMSSSAAECEELGSLCSVVTRSAEGVG